MIFKKLRQLTQRRQFPLSHSDFFRRDTEISLASLQILGYARFGADHGTLTDADPCSDAHLPVKHDPVFEDRFPANTHLAGDQAIFTQNSAMSDVNLAVNFTPVPNDRVPGNTPVDRASGPDIHMIADDDPATRTPFFIPVLVFFKIKSKKFKFIYFFKILIF